MKTERQQLSDLAQKIYKNSGVTCEPLYPNVLVRLLPRAQETASGIVLPERQNKIMIEAVVLGTYKPFWRLFEITRESSNGVRTTANKKELVEPAVKIGDHVIFRHHLGAPVPQLDGGTGDYRLVHETDFDGSLDYEQKNRAYNDLELAMRDGRIGASWLREKYHIIPKDLRPLTTSGA